MRYSVPKDTPHVGVISLFVGGIHKFDYIADVGRFGNILVLPFLRISARMAPLPCQIIYIVATETLYPICLT